jgi:hypothetical protein
MENYKETGKVIFFLFFVPSLLANDGKLKDPKQVINSFIISF